MLVKMTGNDVMLGVGGVFGMTINDFGGGGDQKLQNN